MKFCTNVCWGEWRDSDILEGATTALIGADALIVAPLRYISKFIFCANAYLGEWRVRDILEGATSALIGADALRVAPTA